MSTRDAEAYGLLMLSLLPRGAAWDRDPDGVRGRIYSALNTEYARIDAFFTQLIAERSPRTAFHLLADWEKALGLPDECSKGAETIAERRAVAHARWIATGGASPAYFTAIAKALGFDIRITQYRARWFGYRFLGQPYGEEDMQWVWKVTCQTGTIRPRTFGSAFMGEPFTRWGNQPLVCTLRRLAPAGTTVLFA